MGARGFYFSLYTFFYISAYMYQNTLTDYFKQKEYLSIVLYFMLHAFTIYLFLTTGDNPGWADQNEDLLQSNHYKLSSEEEDEENAK